LQICASGTFNNGVINANLNHPRCKRGRGGPSDNAKTAAVAYCLDVTPPPLGA